MAVPDLSAAFAAAMAKALPGEQRRIGLAVSGGSDSIALMHLAHDWASDRQIDICVSTVDHGLRPEAADEAQAVAKAAAALGLPHQTLHWTGWDQTGNLQNEARKARYSLLADWAIRDRLGVVALGHTRDDNAETFLMGLSRSAGLDGLAGMQPVFQRHGTAFIRPLLDMRREDLRDHLRVRGVPWADDPSNDDPAFQRVRARQALAALAPLGITQDTLADSIAHLRATSAFMDETVSAFLANHVRRDCGDIIIAPDAFAEAPTEVARRVLNRVLCAVSGAAYPPRASKITGFLGEPARKGTTLHGCLITTDGTGLRIAREPQAAEQARPARPGELWDHRWRVTGPQTNVEIRATGAIGLRECPDWRQAGLPRASLMSAPAVWRGSTLLAAPLAGVSNGWNAECCDAMHRFR